MMRINSAMRFDRSLTISDLRASFTAQSQLEAATLVTVNSDFISEASTCLTASEQSRIDRLKSPLHRQNLANNLIARRLWLTDYLGVSTESVLLEHDHSGAPLLRGWAPGEASFSRSNEWCAIALAKGKRVGIDVETDRELNWSGILDYISGPEEADWVRQAVRDAGSLAPFFRVWCSKEALLKVMGTGFRAGPKTLVLPRTLIEGVQLAEVDLPANMALIQITRFDQMTVALATTSI